MTAPLRELLVNDAITQLNGTINDTTTSIVVDDGSVFPSTGYFRIAVDDELMLVTARSTNTLTVVRGIESTTAASHSNSALVSAVLTAGGLEQFGKDSVPVWGYQLPFSKLVADDGGTILTASDFTWVNQETSSVSDQSGTILLSAALTTGLDNRLLTRSAPSTPYAYIGAFHMCGPRGGSDDGVFLTMGFRESSTGKFEHVAIGTNLNRTPQVTAERWTDANTFSATIRGIDMITIVANAIWLKIEDDGTDLTYYVGMDGVNWIELESNSRTAFLAGGPDQVFWGCRNDANNTNRIDVRLLHWSKE